LIKKITLIYFSIVLGLVSFSPTIVNAFCFDNSCKTNKNKNKNILGQNKLSSDLIVSTLSLKNKFETYLKVNNIRLDKLFDKLIASNTDEEQKFSVDIESDIQYQEQDGKINIAEGNVKVTLNNGVLRADKISFNQATKEFNANGNVSFIKANQFFKADSMTYNFIDEKGVLKNLYAVLEIQNLGKDFNYKIKDDEICLENTPSFINPVREIEMLETNNIRFQNKKSLDAFKFKFPSFTRWRMETKEVKIDKNTWKSDLIFLTNDPFNKPQIVFESKDFTAEIFENRTKLKSRASFIIFEDKLRVPIGRRTVNNNDGLAVWGIGSDSDNKDGFYIFRNYQPIKYGEFSLDLTPYYLFQRHINGKTSAFTAKDEAINSDRVESDITFSDLWALDLNLIGLAYGWNIELNGEINSFDINKLDQSHLDFTLSKNLLEYPKSKDEEDESLDKTCIKKPNEEEKTSYSLDLGFYSLYRKERIYTAFGTKLMSDFNYQNKKLNNNIFASADFGEFQAIKEDSEEYITLFRYGLLSSASSTYKIVGGDFSEKLIDKDNRYTSEVIDKGIYIGVRGSAAHYEYSNGKAQSGISASVTPTFIFGDLKKNFFDYTYLALETEYSIQTGRSPFNFDNLNSDTRLSIDFRQQVIGPILFELSGQINLNGGSSNFGKFKNRKYSLGISRRPYSIYAYYKPERDEKGFQINIFDFNYKGNSDRFKNFK